MDFSFKNKGMYKLATIKPWQSLKLVMVELWRNIEFHIFMNILDLVQEWLTKTVTVVK